MFGSFLLIPLEIGIKASSLSLMTVAILVSKNLFIFSRLVFYNLNQ